ncbi:SOSS complex subunit C homolog isoform X2 [Schistocerca piceifrons]|uniref:SOSS complex subunit C homolog isoform X2 n=1 Tax=Schistocerca piceifrons TaxID=274613 RepID=UPI001F5E404B|nr:SOSS complex subunit C homolog isoform X2 [Schistocerca piceifrons]
MSFQQINSRQDLASRKILEEIQLKKQMLLKQGVAPTLNSSSISALPVGVTNPSSMSAEAHMLSPSQRVAMQQANSMSFGFFITQDSLFGNLILPVLPRFHK